MPNLDSVLKHKDDIRYRVVGEEAVVIRQNAAEVLAINDVGARILALIDAKSTVGQLIETMSSEYDVDREVLTQDIENFVAAMHDAGIVEEI